MNIPTKEGCSNMLGIEVKVHSGRSDERDHNFQTYHGRNQLFGIRETDNMSQRKYIISRHLHVISERQNRGIKLLCKI